MSAAPAERADAFLWLVVPALLLMAVPIGFVSSDGLGHSLDFATGQWRLNPNHLLLEPAGAWWQTRVVASLTSREPFDRLKWLSVATGAIAVALFRWSVAPRLVPTRWEANHATAWLALSSAFLRLWISEYTHMIQMPFLVAAAAATLVHLERPSARRAAIVGAAVGLAALAFLSNLLLGVTLGLALGGWHLGRREPRAAAVTVTALGLGAGLVAGPVLLAAWLVSPGVPGFLPWLTRYGGGTMVPRIEAAYGVHLSVQGLAESAVRTLYGAGSALVDLTAIAAAVRDRQEPGPVAVAGALAFLGAAIVLGRGLALAWQERSRPAGRGALVLALGVVAATLGFGLFWNTSHEQFHFQLAPAFGALAALATARRTRAGAVILWVSLAALGWNVADVSARRIFYPRQARVAQMEGAVRGACLVVYPGFDEADMILALTRSARPGAPLRLAELAAGLSAEDGLRALARRVGRCLAAGERVVAIDVFDTPAWRSPWKFLWRLGWDRNRVEQSLMAWPFEGTSRRVGPFTVRAAPAPPA